MCRSQFSFLGGIKNLIFDTLSSVEAMSTRYFKVVFSVSRQLRCYLDKSLHFCEVSFHIVYRSICPVGVTWGVRAHSLYERAHLKTVSHVPQSFGVKSFKIIELLLLLQSSERENCLYFSFHPVIKRSVPKIKTFSRQKH